MKVLMTSHFPLAGSGSGTYTLNIAKHLTDEGHEVCVLMPENTTNFAVPENIGIYTVFFTDTENSDRIEGALPFNFPCFTSHPRSTQTFYDLSDEQLDAYMSAFRKAAEKAVKEFSPDIIHAQHIWLLSEIARETGIPYVITAHGTDLMGYQKTARFRKDAHSAASGAKRIVTISEDNDMLVKELFPDCAGKTAYIKNGYDPSRFFPAKVVKEEVLAEHDIPPSAHIVLFTGKLTHFKGVDILLQAAKFYEGEHPGKITTIVAGEGDLSDKLKKQAKSLKLRNTHFIGFLPVFQLRNLYSAADVTVVPSRREPFGLVALEALACGSPVIATNQGGLPDIINDKVGRLVDVDDPHGLAEAVTAEVFNPNRAEKSRVAAEYVKLNFAQDKLIGALTDIYEESIKR
ncbi:MAG: glycosyltransferase family 4 protein [Oscillospiraceae bacterium]|nr:glycosyltransferase family 4 protein [Oscillospiraceae bacterium]